MNMDFLDTNIVVYANDSPTCPMTHLRRGRKRRCAPRRFVIIEAAPIDRVGGRRESGTGTGKQRRRTGLQEDGAGRARLSTSKGTK